MGDKRKNRTQKISLKDGFLAVDLHKTLFIKDRMKSIEKYYVLSWGKSVYSNHQRGQKWKDVRLVYHPPDDSIDSVSKFFLVDLSISNSKGRTKESCYRIKWDRDFSIQLAKDYPKSFVRSLEFDIGDEYYKEKEYTEFDIGGFKEQIQLSIKWNEDKPSAPPVIEVRELFRVPDESMTFPNVFKELSGYLIADYLTSDDKQRLRRLNRVEWSKREEIDTELKENNIYILINKSQRRVYLGETRESLKSRYPKNSEHHSFKDWEEYSIIHLPEGTSDFERRLIERVLIETYTALFPNLLGVEPAFNDSDIKIVNLKK